MEKKVLEKGDKIWEGSKVIFPSGQVIVKIIFLLVVEDISFFKAANRSLFSTSVQKRFHDIDLAFRISRWYSVLRTRVEDELYTFNLVYLEYSSTRKVL